jgi:hypothetical protein
MPKQKLPQAPPTTPDRTPDGDVVPQDYPDSEKIPF